MGTPTLYIRWLEACVCTASFSVRYNGTVQGYFKSSRGLRQGDPLSPYLFIVAMNCLSLLLNKAASEEKFGYHIKCADSKLTHLCFANDLLIFTNGDKQSVKGVLEVLREFEGHSGLGVSTSKTCFFTCGVPEPEIAAITEELGLSHGSLPIRYLGVPLCTRKLSLSNCEPLISSIKGKLNSWSTITLSFACRLLLINTVLAGITNFWCSSFTLPKACIKIINSMCGAYLWKGTLEGHHSARVAWETIVHAKEEGGLRIRDLVSWNKATSIRLIWLLFFSSCSIWVAWFAKEVLSGDRSNFWTIKETNNHSWLVKRLLRLRPLVYNWIHVKLGNGTHTRFWSDNWSPYGNVAEFLQLQPNSRLGIPRQATVSDLFINGYWILPPARSDAHVLLQSFISSITLNQEEYQFTWTISKKTSAVYNTGIIYNELKHHNLIVPWAKTVWLRQGIPKHSFLAWLLLLNRCPTRDRLLNWGLPIDPSCLLCNSAPENRDHLFFQCPYSWRFWSHIARRSGLQPSPSWDHTDTVTDLQQTRRSRHVCYLSTLSWQCTTYMIWSERNGRLHRHIFKPPEMIISSIEATISAKISAIKDSSPRLSSSVFSAWNS